MIRKSLREMTPQVALLSMRSLQLMALLTASLLNSNASRPSSTKASLPKNKPNKQSVDYSTTSSSYADLYVGVDGHPPHPPKALERFHAQSPPGARKPRFRAESVPKTLPVISTVTTPPGRCL